MLDRGTGKDWFSSGEIIAEAIIAGLALYIFVVHMFTTKKSFIPMEIFRDRNFLSSLALMFMVGMVMLASTALLPPYLQNLGGYSVTQTGLLLAPRGVGTMFAMMFAGRLALKMDARFLMGFGTILLLWSMWEMSTWTPDITEWTLTYTTFIQGIGMGLIFVPMNLVGFATLSPALRTDGSALINLVRNVGSAFGISVTTTVLAMSIQQIHAQMAGHFSPLNPALHVNAPSLMLNPILPMGAMNAERMVNYNAQVSAYANDFIFMFWASLPALLVIFLMKRPVIVPPAPGEAPKKIELEVME
jgi:DHA2 family multidrug resistance protein